MNQESLTLRCLESLERVSGVRSRILLWDNGSEDGTCEAVAARFPEVQTHHHPTNLGVASGRNAASRLATELFEPEFFFFLDNDMIVEPDFLAPLVAVVRNDSSIGLATGKIRMLEEPARLYGAGGCGVRFWLGNTTHVGFGELDRGQYDTPVNCIPSGGCMLIRRSLFEELGGFDTLFDPYGPEDLDLGLRARQAGQRGYYVPQSVVLHQSHPGRTFEGGHYTTLYAANRARHWFHFMGRHASLSQKLGFYCIGAPWLLALLTLREARRGNLLPAVAGLARGGLQFLRGGGDPR
jgi:GT2 family glycosyltransferase